MVPNTSHRISHTISHTTICVDERHRMKTQYAGLITRGRCFYFRVAIPQRYWCLTKCHEIGYSLNTCSYEQAVRKWRFELYHFQQFMKTFEDVCMKVENGKVLLNTTDVDKVLLYELERKQFIIEERADDIAEGTITAKDVELYAENETQNKIKQLMEQIVIEYLQDIIVKQKANATLRTIYKKLQEKEIALGLVEQDDTGYQWFNSLTRQMGALQKYLRKSVQSIHDDEAYTPTNPKVASLLRTYDEKKTKERLTTSSSHTSWEKVFKKFITHKKNLNGLGEQRMLGIKRILKVCFALLGKDLESITQQDCRKLCDNLYKVPKRWSGALEQGETIGSVLNTGKTPIAKKTVKEYLITFKEFMRYCVREEIITNSFNEAIELPAHFQQQERTPFTTSELKKIFNIKTYPNPKCRDNQAKFWIPLIALFQGCRLNEICQLDVDDIVAYEGLECISINANAKDKSVKNKSSQRIIPIHPVLKDIGFTRYIYYQSKTKKHKLFSELTYRSQSGYKSIIQKWFARYLDSIGIKGKDKVFHSFRHTFETKALEKLLHTEHQNRLCGWTNKGIGQSVYGKKLHMRVLYDELCKIDYPIKKELNALKEEYAKTYVMKFKD